MAQLFDFKKVTIGPRALVATMELSPSAPLMTSEDPEAVDLVLDLMPALNDHVCLGDAAPVFGEVAYDTELAHLLEHVTVELLAQTDIAGDIACGQTSQVGERLYEVTLGCPDDVLVVGALSSAAWILQWAFAGGGDPRPDIEAIVAGLVNLVESVSDVEPAEDEIPTEVEKNEDAEEEPAMPLESAEEPAAADEVEAEPVPQYVPEAEPEDVPMTEPEVEPDPLPETELGPEPELAPDVESEPAQESEPDTASPTDSEPVPAAGSEPATDPDPAPATEPEPDLTPESIPTPSMWDMDDVPRPHLVR